MTEPLLRVRNLRTYFHRRHHVIKALDGVDIDLAAGRTLCLVGESGSGKSLTALSIMGLIARPGRIEPDSEITFEGRDLLAASQKELRSIRGNQISMIFQEPMTSLNPAHSAGAQIAEAVLLHMNVGKREAWDRAVEMLALVGVPDPGRRASSYPHQLSGGMRQRVMIAMALACEPKLIIADEPTTALDVTIQAQILELLRELRDRIGMAVLMITHDLGVVAEMADDVAVMYAGRVVERGLVADIFSSPQHPYTQALLRSIPVLGMTKEDRLAVIPGMVPSPVRWPVGCRFADRCEFTHDRCASYPPLFRVGQQSVACWLRESRTVESGAVTA